MDFDCRLGYRPVRFGHIHVHSIFGRDSQSELRLRDPGPRVEPRRLLPIDGQGLGQPGSDGHNRPRCLHASAKIAQPPLRVPLVRLPRIIGEAARDLEEAELPDRASDGSTLTLCEPVDIAGGAPVAERHLLPLVHTFVALPVREFPFLSDPTRLFPQQTSGPPEVARFHRIVTVRTLFQTREQRNPPDGRPG